MNKGFTLIELIVVISVMAILLVTVLGFLDPFQQFSKAKDSQRQQDLNQIRVSLDAYYNDTGCYPSSLTFKSLFANPSNASTVYMKVVPQDPDCAANPTQCYQYITDTTTSCPQWNVLLGVLRTHSLAQQQQSLCPLETLNANTQGGCLPGYYRTAGYNFCLTSGKINCSIVDAAIPNTVPTPIPGCQKIYSCESPSALLPKGTCNNVGTDANGNGLGQYCGGPGCIGNDCCLDNCSN